MIYFLEKKAADVIINYNIFCARFNYKERYKMKRANYFLEKSMFRFERSLKVQYHVQKCEM